MKLSLQTDYSLRTLMFLASHPGRQTVEAVARYYKVSEPHIAKVVNQLARFGFIRSIRGAGGGIELGKKPHDIVVGDVIQAVEGTTHLLDCIGNDDVCRIQLQCRLRGILVHAEELQMNYLRTIKLSDIVPIPSEEQLNLVQIQA
ncbi:MAG: Rrf2 family transcriptional regulator [Planctomycetales bacterium]